MNLPAHAKTLLEALKDCQSAIAYWESAGIHTLNGPVDIRLHVANNKARALLAQIEQG